MAPWKLGITIVLSGMLLAARAGAAQGSGAPVLLPAAPAPPGPADAAAPPGPADAAAPPGPADAAAPPGPADAATPAHEEPAALPAAAPAPDPAPDSADRALLDSLLALLDADADAGRASAAEQLGKLGDERAVLPLASALRDVQPEVRAAAALALGAYPRARAELALTRVLERESETLPVQVAALRALGRHRTQTAGQQLLAYYRDGDRPAAARNAAERVLEEQYPELLAAAGKIAVVEHKGRLVLVPAAAGLGSYALAAVGSLGVNSDTAVPIGVVGGLVLGGGAAYLITADAGVTMPQGIWFATTGSWGLTEGLLLGWSLQPSGGTRVTTASGLVGELAGLGLFLYSRQELALQSDELAAVNLGGVAGVLGGLGLSLVTDLDSKGATAVVAGGALAALTASALAAPSMETTGTDAGLVAVATAHGATVGLLLPLALDAQGNGSGLVGSMLLTSAIAYGATASTSQLIRPTAEENVRLLTLPGFGYLVGTGAPLLLNDDDGPTMARSALAGAAVGTAGALLAPEWFRLDPGDGAFVPIASAYGLWQGGGWAAWLSMRGDLADNRAAGLAVAAPGLAGWAAVAAARPLDVEPLQTLAMSSGAFWGIWYAGFVGYLVDFDARNLLSGMLLSSDVGVAGAIGLMALGVDESRIGLASAGGLTGAALFSLGSALVTTDGDTTVTANLVGTTLGLAGGALLGGYVLPARGADDDEDHDDESRLSLGTFLLEPGVGQARGVHGEPIPLLTLSLR